MKLLSIVFALLFFAGDEIPFKPKEEFELKLELQFKQRSVDRTKFKVGLEYDKTNSNSGPLPYLYLHLVIVKQQPDEAKVKVIDNLGRTLKIMYHPMNTRSCSFPQRRKSCAGY
jgi:hypothetical protein